MNAINGRYNYKIVFEDEFIIVVHKGAGLAVSSARAYQMDLVTMLTKYLATPENRRPYLGVIHRLDQPVEGLIVFAKNSEAAAFLSKQAAGTDMEKIYDARLYGHVEEVEGIFEDYLIKDGRNNTTSISSKDQKDSKYSKLSYKVIATDELTDTVRIKLYTGRHHQIRVQFASRGCPLVGDTKYGTEESIEFSNINCIKNVSLRAVELSFIHPVSKKRVTYRL